ncbi:hypothetical protein VTH06DRAFT_2666 [Thermothelomyces fergusii]
MISLVLWTIPCYSNSFISRHLDGLYISLSFFSTFCLGVFGVGKSRRFQVRFPPYFLLRFRWRKEDASGFHSCYDWSKRDSRGHGVGKIQAVGVFQQGHCGSQKGTDFMTLRYPMGNGLHGHSKSAFWGKQKSFNIFSFPGSLDVDRDLFGLAGTTQRVVSATLDLGAMESPERGRGKWWFLGWEMDRSIAAVSSSWN